MMDLIISLLENQMTGATIGYLLGFFSAAFIIQLVRCENCCQQDDDSAAYWLKKLSRREGDRE